MSASFLVNRVTVEPTPTVGGLTPRPETVKNSSTPAVRAMPTTSRPTKSVKTTVVTLGVNLNVSKELPLLTPMETSSSVEEALLLQPLALPTIIATMMVLLMAAAPHKVF